jgi:hypothetical protein
MCALFRVVPSYQRIVKPPFSGKIRQALQTLCENLHAFLHTSQVRNQWKSCQCLNCIEKRSSDLLKYDIEGCTVVTWTISFICTQATVAVV